MGKPEDIINISELSEAAKAELLDFYEFLKTKHAGNKCAIVRHPLEKFTSDPIKVEKIKKYTRDELHAR